MRTAYSGRAAAYEARGDTERALADLNMVVLYYGIEVEILMNLEAPDRADVMAEAAAACRARARVLTARGRSDAARADAERADKLEADAKKIMATVAKKPEGDTGRIEIINRWSNPVTVIIDGQTYIVPAGETRKVTHTAGSFTYEVRDVQIPVVRQVKAGETYTIRIEAP